MKRNLLIALALAALVFVLDQASKAWILGAVKATGHFIEVIPGCFNLIYAENTSAAFGLLSFLPYLLRLIVLSGFAVGVGVVMVVGLVQGKIQRPWTVVATGLILGGALGNALDRVRHGFVVDFIDWHIAEKFHWNVFNVADSAVVVGVAILLLTSERKEGTVSAKAAAL